MGDRRQVVIKDRWTEDKEIYLYTHWGGYRLPTTVQDALKKKWRWDDSAYLTRIIFDEMVGKEQGGETGFGISAGCMDSSYADIYIDTAKGIISIGDDEWSFSDYIALDLSEDE